MRLRACIALKEALDAYEKRGRPQVSATGGWVVRLTDAPLDLDNPAHLEALKRAYERFPEIGGRSTP